MKNWPSWIFFCFFLIKISPNSYGRLDGSKFWCFLWFPVNLLLCVIKRYTVYITVMLPFARLDCLSGANWPIKMSGDNGWYHAGTKDTSKFKCNSNVIPRQIFKLKINRPGPFPQVKIFQTIGLASVSSISWEVYDN